MVLTVTVGVLVGIPAHQPWEIGCCSPLCQTGFSIFLLSCVPGPGGIPGWPNPDVCPGLPCKGCWESKPLVWLPQWEQALPLTKFTQWELPTWNQDIQVLHSPRKLSVPKPTQIPNSRLHLHFSLSPASHHSPSLIAHLI